MGGVRSMRVWTRPRPVSPEEIIYLEAYVDPNQNFPQQRTVENNVGRAKFRVPTFSGPGSVIWTSFCQEKLYCNYSLDGACGRYFGGTP